MNRNINIKVGDYVFNKDDVAKGLTTILFRVDKVHERTLKRYNETTKEYEPYAQETLVDAYCLATSHGYSIGIRHDKDEWGIIPAETMKVLCAE